MSSEDRAIALRYGMGVVVLLACVIAAVWFYVATTVKVDKRNPLLEAKVAEHSKFEDAQVAVRHALESPSGIEFRSIRSSHKYDTAVCGEVRYIDSYGVHSSFTRFLVMGKEIALVESSALDAAGSRGFNKLWKEICDPEWLL